MTGQKVSKLARFWAHRSSTYRSSTWCDFCKTYGLGPLSNGRTVNFWYDTIRYDMIDGTVSSSRRHGLYVHPQAIWHIRLLFRLQGPNSKNVRSLSLARQLATHYRMTFAKSQTLITFRWHLKFYFSIIIITYRPRLRFYVVPVRYELCEVCNTLLDS